MDKKVRLLSLNRDIHGVLCKTKKNPKITVRLIVIAKF